MEVPGKKRSTTQCYWEKQPSGCKKPHCPFLHDAPKPAYPEEILAEKPAVLPAVAPGTNILVNPAKMGELKGLILPERVAGEPKVIRKEVTAPFVREGERLVVRSEKRSLKDRLGPGTHVK